MTRFALLLSLLALGALGLVACDDDDKTATAETEVITSDFGAVGPEAGAGAPDACGDFRSQGPGGYPVEIDVLEGVVPCREAQRVLKNYFLGRNKAPWSCVGQGDRGVECVKRAGVAFAGHFYCRVWTDQALCLRRFGTP